MASGPLLISPLVRNQANYPDTECWPNEGRKNADEEHMLGLPNKLYRRRYPVRRLAVSRAALHETSRVCGVSWEPASAPIRMMRLARRTLLPRCLTRLDGCSRCGTALVCFSFLKLLKIDGCDVGGEGGDARVEVVARNGSHLCEARCPTGKMLLEELFRQVEVCLR